MSRSYKKNPYVTDHKCGTTKNSKRLANQSFRRQIAADEDMPSRPAHKKYTESWMISDYGWRMTREEAIEWYNDPSTYKTEYFKKRYPTLDSWLNYWEKCYRRK